MPQQQLAKLRWAPLDDAKPAVDDTEVLEPVLHSNVVHARAFQQRLAEAYHPIVEEQKLPVPQRLAIILGLTCALWMIVGIAIISIIYAYSQIAS